jgi:uncharacterized protein YecE (DUF72 family)
MSRTISSSGHPSDSSSGDTAAVGVPHIGCSGWHYKSWKGLIYPPELPTTEWLRDYTRRFSTVELNNSFYRLPSEDTFAGWREQVPRGFLFAVKASRFLTHIKRLREPEEPLQRLLTHAKPLGPTLGPVLYQIPPRWFPDPERLEMFLAALPERVTPTSRQRLHHVLEMRDPRGYEPWVLELLRQYRVTLCVHDMPGSESPLVMTGRIVYLRFHGYGTKYGGSYPDEVLDEWAQWIRRALATGRDVYAYFNNDINGYAVYDAERLRIRIEGAAALKGRAPMTKPAWQDNAAAYPSYPTRHGRPRASAATSRRRVRRISPVPPVAKETD